MIFCVGAGERSGGEDAGAAAGGGRKAGSRGDSDGRWRMRCARFFLFYIFFKQMMIFK
eukprot:COSAG06_NODE_2456_length_6848_cov_66.970959_6_plen_58_part_00